MTTPPPRKRRRQTKLKVEKEHKESDTSNSGSTKNDALNSFNQECMKNRIAGAAKSPSLFKFDETRISGLKNGTHGICNGKNFQDFSNITGVAYWMSRDQRVQDNWSLVYAQKMALQHQVPLFVVFCLLPKFLDGK